MALNTNTYQAIPIFKKFLLSILAIENLIINQEINKKISKSNNYILLINIYKNINSNNIALTKIKNKYIYIKKINYNKINLYLNKY